MFGFHRSDLRPAALRGLVLFVVLITFLLLIGRSNLSPFATVAIFGAQASCLALIAAALALIELGAVRRSARALGTAQVALAAALLASCYMTQSVVSLHVVMKGSIRAGLSAGIDAFLFSVKQDTGDFLKSSLLFALPWTVVAGARVQRALNPTFAVVGWAAVLGSPLLALHWKPWALLIVLTLVLHALFRVADALERWFLRRDLREELDARAGLREHQLWHLAVTGDRAAQLLLGGSTPQPEPELGAWVRQLAQGSVESLQHAAAAGARLTQPWAPEYAFAFTALSAWDDAPGPETVEAAAAALAGIPERPHHPAVIAIREALTAVTATSAWASETVRRAARRVLEQAAALNDPETVRAAVASAARDRWLGRRGAPTLRVVGVV